MHNNLHANYSNIKWRTLDLERCTVWGAPHVFEALQSEGAEEAFKKIADALQNQPSKTEKHF